MAVHHHIHLALKKSAKIEMKELMKGQLRNLHLPKLSSIERFKMAFVKVIELIGVFLPDCSKNDVSMLLAWHVHSLISASNQKSTCHNLLTWNPQKSMRIVPVALRRAYFSLPSPEPLRHVPRCRTHWRHNVDVGSTSCRALGSLIVFWHWDPVLWTNFCQLGFLSKNLYKCLLRCQKLKIHLCKNGFFQLLCYTLPVFIESFVKVARNQEKSLHIRSFSPTNSSKVHLHLQLNFIQHHSVTSSSSLQNLLSSLTKNQAANTNGYIWKRLYLKGNDHYYWRCLPIFQWNTMEDGKIVERYLNQKSQDAKKTRTCQKAFPKANNPLPTIDFQGQTGCFQGGYLN